MNEPIIYNIPAAMFERYRGRPLVIRCGDPAEVLDRLTREELERLECIQIHPPFAGIDVLMRLGHAVPVDLVVGDARTGLPLLYQASPLLARHPIRVSLPVSPGFGALLKLAVSLNFAVKLEVSQPDRALAAELLDFARQYLRRSTISEPVEFFHGLFLAFYHQYPVTLWSIQEEDPSRCRYVTDQGEETISSRFVGAKPGGDPLSFVRDFGERLAANGGECRGCEFFANCEGYFKWPDERYGCDGMKAVLRALREAADELREDLAAYQGGDEAQP